MGILTAVAHTWLPHTLEARVWQTRLACVAVAAALAVGLWANWPYLVVEHRRLEAWKSAGLWAGDVMGLLWFIRFTFTYAALGEPLTPVPVSDGRRRLRALALAGVAALLIDLAFSFYLMREEREGYAGGKVADAQVMALKVHQRLAATGYDLYCAFRDQAEVAHKAHMRVLATHHILPTTLPAEAARVLEVRGEGPKVIRIRYDPRLPARAWIDGLGWEDVNGLYWFSVGTACLQAGAIAIFLLALKGRTTGNTWPWWWDTYKILPLAAETFCMLAMGLIDRAMDLLG